MKFDLVETITKIETILIEDDGGGGGDFSGGEYSGLPSTNTGNLGFNDEGLDLNNTSSGLVPMYTVLQSRYPYLGLTYYTPKKRNAKRKKRRKMD